MQMNMKKKLLLMMYASVFSWQAFSQSFVSPDPLVVHPVSSALKIQIGIALDTSGSMSGLIEQTKRQLWKLVNSLSSYQLNGKKPELEIAILQYGSSQLPASSGYMRILSPLSTQLDQVSQKLFSLKANGSEEFVPMVIAKSALALDWENSSDTVRSLFVAGNETIHQGPVKADSLKDLMKQLFIPVNTIFAGSADAAVFQEWQKLATDLDGSSGNIDPSLQIPDIKSPFDQKLIDLNEAFNKTIIVYGSNGQGSLDSYLHTDALYGGSGGSFYDLVGAKTSGFYDMSKWDLVVAIKEKNLDIATVDKSKLPTDLQTLSNAEILAIVDAKYLERKQIEATIVATVKQREDYLAPLIEAVIGKAEGLIQETLIKSIAKQLEAKGYTK